MSSSSLPPKLRPLVAWLDTLTHVGDACASSNSGTHQVHNRQTPVVEFAHGAGI